MTEAERILKKGIVNEQFLAAEEILGFWVTEKRKRLFAVLLDMLVEIDAVCKKYGLRYFLCGGSLLGAIRHKGFIPWDDDIDIEMPRKDYEKLLQLSAEFKPPYFLENPHTDPYYAYSYSRLVNDNTTAVVKPFAFQPIHHGIWISIFPVDRWLEHDIENFKLMDRLNYENSTYMRLTNPWLDEQNMARVKRWSGRNPVEIYDEVQRIATQYHSADTPYMRRMVVTAIGFLQLYYAEDFSTSIPHEYEGYQFQIPVGWDRMLRIKYGDYMQLPPMEKRGNWHSTTIFDPDVPYVEFLEEYKKDRNRIYESQL